MKLQKAIASGKPFRLPHHKFWIIVKDDTFIAFNDAITMGSGNTVTMTITFTPKSKKKVKTTGWKKEKFDIKMATFPVAMKPSSIFSDKWETLT